MARGSAAASIDSILQDAVRPIVAKVSTAIAKSVGAMVAEQLDRELRLARPRGRPDARRGARSATRPRKEITSWTADRRARRVPKFVILATNLDTKKKIVAKFGANATFEKGKALPKAK